MPHVKSNNPNFIIAHKTDAGRSGKNNEDDYAVFEGRYQPSDGAAAQTAQIAVVADGIGGSVSGEVASRTAIETMVESLTAKPIQNVGASLEHAIRTANRQIFVKSQELPEMRGMGTTMVAAVIIGDQLHLAHAGDSRAYLIRGGQIYLLTLDHSWAQEAIDAGYLSIEKAQHHPNKNVIKRFLGPLDHVDVDPTIIDVDNRQGSVLLPENRTLAPNNRLQLRPHDTLLLCSDGLTDVVTEQIILNTIAQHSPQQAATELVRLANAGGGPDNITVVLVHWPGGMPKAATSSIFTGGAKDKTEIIQPAMAVPVAAPVAAPVTANSGGALKAPRAAPSNRTLGNGLIGLALVLAAVGLVWVILQAAGPMMNPISDVTPGSAALTPAQGDGDTSPNDSGEEGNTAPVALALPATETPTVTSTPTETATATPTDPPTETPTVESTSAPVAENEVDENENVGVAGGVAASGEDAPTAELSSPTGANTSEAEVSASTTATATQTARRATSTPAKPTATPTPTITNTPTPRPMPSSTPTPRPTATPNPQAPTVSAPTVSAPTATPTSEPVANSGQPVSTEVNSTYSYQIAAPADGALLNDSRATFEWNTNIILKPGQHLELIFWPKSEGLGGWTGGRGPTGAKLPSSTAPIWIENINLDNFRDQQSAFFTPGEYYWGVAVVVVEPEYRKLALLGPGVRFFDYQPANESAPSPSNERPCIPGRDPNC